MPVEVDVDGIGTVEFPDEMKPEEIHAALEKMPVPTKWGNLPASVYRAASALPAPTPSDLDELELDYFKTQKAEHSKAHQEWEQKKKEFDTWSLEQTKARQGWVEPKHDYDNPLVPQAAPDQGWQKPKQDFDKPLALTPPDPNAPAEPGPEPQAPAAPALRIDEISRDEAIKRVTADWGKPNVRGTLEEQQAEKDRQQRQTVKEYADTVAKAVGRQSNQKFQDEMAKRLVTYKIAKHVLEEGATSIIGDVDDMKKYDIDRGDVLEALAEFKGAKRPNADKGVVQRTGELGVQKLQDVDQAAKMPMGAALDLTDWIGHKAGTEGPGLGELTDYVNKLEQVRRSTDPLVLPEDSWGTKLGMGIVSELPKLGLAAAGGPAGLAIEYGAPRAFGTSEAIKDAGGNKALAALGGVAAGITETALFTPRAASILEQLGGAAGRTVKQSLVHSAYDTLKTAGTMTASGVQAAVIKAAAVAASGKDPKLGEDLAEEWKSLPDTAIQAILLHILPTIASATKSRKAAEAAGLEGTNKPERDDILAKAEYVLKTLRSQIAAQAAQPAATPQPQGEVQNAQVETKQQATGPEGPANVPSQGQDAGHEGQSATPTEEVKPQPLLDETYDKIHGVLSNITDKASLATATPYLKVLYPEYASDPVDPWGIGRAVQRGDEIPRVPTADLSIRIRTAIKDGRLTHDGEISAPTTPEKPPDETLDRPPTPATQPNEPAQPGEAEKAVPTQPRAEEIKPQVGTRVAYMANDEPHTGKVLAEEKGGFRVKSDSGPTHFVTPDDIVSAVTGKPPDSLLRKHPAGMMSLLDEIQEINATVDREGEEAAEKRLRYLPTEAEMAKRLRETKERKPATEAVGEAQDTPPPGDKGDKGTQDSPTAEKPETVGIKNRIMDALRSNDRGLETPERTAPQSRRQWLNQASTKRQAEPNWIPDVIAELDRKPRNLSPMEIAGMQIHYLDLNNRFQDAADKQAVARSSGDADAFKAATTETNLIAEQLGKFEDSVQGGKSQWGRAGNALQIELLRDGSIAALSRRFRAAKGGEELTPEENEKIADLSAKLKESEEKFKAHLESEANNKLERQIAEDKAGQVARTAERRRGTYRARLEKLWDTAKRGGLAPEALQEQAKRLAEDEGKANEEYNRQWRGMVHDMHTSQAKLEEARNKGEDSISGINDVMAREMAARYPDLGMRPTPEGAEQTEDFRQQIADIVDRGQKPVPEWIDKLDEAAKSMVSAREEAAKKGDAYEEPGGGFPEDASSFDPDEFKLESEPHGKPTEKTKATGSKKPISGKRQAAREKVNKALDNYKAIRAKNKGVYTGSTKIVPEILLEPERFSAALDVVKAYIELGFTRLSEVWADVKSSISSLGEKPEEDYPHFVAAWRHEQKEGNVESPVSDPDDFDQISTVAREIQRDVIESGVGKGMDAGVEREAIVDAVHEQMKDIVPDMTRDDTRLALSRYGKYRELPKDATSVKAREINGEIRELQKLEDMETGKAPAKSGIEGPELSEEGRRLRKLVEERKKKGGYTVTDPAKSLATALGSAKTAIRNRMKDLEQEITTKEKIVKERNILKPDQELTDLRKQYDELKEAHEQIFKKGMSPEEQVAAAIRVIDKSNSRLERQIAENDIQAKQKGDRPFSPELEAKRARSASLKAQLEELRANDPKYQATKAAKLAEAKEKQKDVRQIEKDLDEKDAKRRQTAAYKRNLTKRLAELNERLAKLNRGETPGKKPIKRTVLDKEAMDLKTQVESKWDDIRKAEARLRAANRTKTEKAFDIAGKYTVAGVLSGVGIFGKLAGAAAARFVTLPAEEAVGGGLSKLPLLSKIAAKAPSEGGMNLGAYGRSLRQVFTLEDAKETLKTIYDKAKLDILHGKDSTGNPLSEFAKQELTGKIETLLDLFGRLHSAMKSPVKRMAFRADFEKRMEWYSRQNDPITGQPVDVDDPMVQVRIAEESYKQANRSIFMQDHRLTNWIRSGLRAKIDPETGHASAGQKAKEFAGKVALPVLNIPLNIVGETLTYAFGTASGGAQILKKLYDAGGSIDKMVENLKPEEADQIMRHLKKGSVGAAFLLAGFLNPGSIGGYYQPGKKRDQDDVDYGGMKLLGVNIPKLLLHNPLLECLQIGATIRRVSESYKRKTDTEPKGLEAGAEAALLGLADETPFMRQIMDIGKIREGRQTIPDYLMDRAIPSGAKQIYQAINPPPEKKTPLRSKSR
jgi:hypothetical protein